MEQVKFVDLRVNVERNTAYFLVADLVDTSTAQKFTNPDGIDFFLKQRSGSRLGILNIYDSENNKVGADHELVSYYQGLIEEGKLVRNKSAIPGRITDEKVKHPETGKELDRLYWATQPE